MRSATVAIVTPVSGNEDGKGISIPGFVPQTPDDLVAQVNTVGPEYLTTFGIRMVRGRGIAAGDVKGAPQVALVSEAAARYYFAGADPIGWQVQLIVVAGRLTLTIDGAAQTVDVGSTIFASHHAHSFANHGRVPVRFYRMTIC